MWTCRKCGKAVPFAAQPIEVQCTCGYVDKEPEYAMPSRGLGDTIAKVTRKLGIKPCGGCKERQKLLNALVPYRTS